MGVKYSAVGFHQTWTRYCLSAKQRSVSRGLLSSVGPCEVRMRVCLWCGRNLSIPGVPCAVALTDSVDKPPQDCSPHPTPHTVNWVRPHCFSHAQNDSDHTVYKISPPGALSIILWFHLLIVFNLIFSVIFLWGGGYCWNNTNNNYFVCNEISAYCVWFKTMIRCQKQIFWNWNNQMWAGNVIRVGISSVYSIKTQRTLCVKLAFPT